ncbi:M81 family metallopeptidase [Thioalkalivibrio sp. HK1]|uniref:M81 family metallopeptidase n=1 Tax=Thioalkalivibrio sp. HK1 TaxID=1469245 RepID=UPI0004714AA9|nr:M81 family metallopeptidase [Thioalkalivibrio sp. HK1]
MPRIAIAGFQHETNTFSPTPTGWKEFCMADSWPGLLQGPKVIDGTRGMNLPIAGAIEAARASGQPIELIPILWCAAEPGGAVTDEAFERISGMILEGIAGAGALDAIYLDLHGAMVTESLDDGEAELLARIRRITGSGMPIGISLDLHANLSPDFVENAGPITIFRSYPHLDMADTGARCMIEILKRLNGAPQFAAFEQIPFLVPLHAQNTGIEPCRTLYRSLDELPASPDEYADIAMGFTAADVPNCGPSIVAYAKTRARAEALARDLFERFCACEGKFDTALFSADEAVHRAISMQGSGPAVLADVQDNPGAGASADTTGLLRALVDGGAQRASTGKEPGFIRALLGTMHDRKIAVDAHAAGTGVIFSGELGGKSGIAGDGPFIGRFEVRALSEGRIPYTGEMYRGGIAQIGPSALLSVEGAKREILVVVSSERTQCLDLALFTHFGVDPFEFDIVCVKSTVHFRADFEAGSRAILNVAAPGLFSCEPEKQTFRRLRKGVRIGSCGKA